MDRSRWERWLRERLDEMALVPLSDEPLPARCRAFRLLCCPTFHPSCCVTAYDLDGIGEIRGVYERSGQSFEVRAEVAADRIAALRDELLALEPETFDDVVDGRGRDGMAIHGEAQCEGIVHDWHVLTADVDAPMPRHHRWCTRLLDGIVEWTTDTALHEVVRGIRPHLAPLEPGE